jgi:hypothetical protein
VTAGEPVAAGQTVAFPDRLCDSSNVEGGAYIGVLADDLARGVD